MAKEATRVRRRERKNISSGVAHVNSTFNNTMITITDAQGNAIAWSSAGAQGFKGVRASRPRLPLRSLPKTAPRRHRNMACAPSKSRFADRALAVNPRCAPFRLPAL